LLTRLLGIKASDHQDKEEKELQLYLVRSTLHFLDEEFGQKLEDNVRNALKLEYGQIAEKLVVEIATHKRNEKRKEQSPVRTLTETQKAQIEIGLFQRKILLRLHKDGNISNEVIRQVEKEMDIDELKFQQLLPKEPE